MLSYPHNGEYELGAEAPRADSHPNQPNSRAAATLAAIHRHPNPLLLKLELPSAPLPALLLVAAAAREMGLVSVHQKGAKIRVAGDLLEVQMPLPIASAADFGERGGGRRVGRRGEEEICEVQIEAEKAGDRCESIDSNSSS